MNQQQRIIDAVATYRRDRSERAWVNLGCGKFPLDGYINVDAHEPSDVKADVWSLAFRDCGVVQMDHFLEHFSWRETVPLLELVRGWLYAGGMVEVEVPDMEEIMRNGSDFQDWLRYVYGSQQHDGEYHKAGFTINSLFDALEDAGYHEIKVRKFVSGFKTRKGMPCLHGTGRA